MRSILFAALLTLPTLAAAQTPRDLARLTWPLGGPTVVADTIADIEALGLPDADAAAIFAENAGRVLRIPA